jgi:hypothetical protein
MERTIRRVSKDFAFATTHKEQILSTINSYLGMLRHMSAFKLRRRMCSMIENSPLTAVFDYAEDYAKITIRHRYSTQVFYMAAYRATKQRYRLAA